MAFRNLKYADVARLIFPIPFPASNCTHLFSPTTDCIVLKCPNSDFALGRTGVPKEGHLSIDLPTSYQLWFWKFSTKKDIAADVLKSK